MLWALAALVLLFSGIAAYLFFAPFFIVINSRSGLLQFRFHRLASVQLIITGEELQLRLKIAWWKKDFNLLQAQTLPQKAKQPKPVRQAPAPALTIKKVLAVVKSFKINQCHISIDTGNMVSNGLVYPWVSLFALYTGYDLQVNFWEEETVVLQIENNLARMGWAYITN